MLPSLPSLAPRDSHSLWYSPTHHTSIPSYHDTSNHSHSHAHEPFIHTTTHSTTNQNHGPQSTRRPHQQALHRTPLSRLVADEIYQARRKANIQNYGNSWLRPPGVPKSLYQLREEEREIAEHAEVMRREALAQELAEAEAEAAVELEELMVPDEEVRDLDDDIPEAEGGLLGDLDDDDDDDSDSDDSDEDDDELGSDEDEEEEVDRTVEDERMRIVAQRMEHGFGMDGLGGSGSESGEENEDQMLREEDLVRESRARIVGDGDTEMGGMDMDADLDDEVPDADIGGYEHTDTEEEDSSSVGDVSVDMGRLPLQSNFVSSMVRSDGTQNSLDLRSISSLQESSPRQRVSRRRRN